MVSEPARDAAAAARRGGKAAADGAMRAARSGGGRMLARGGFVFVGLLHLIIAYLALRVAFGVRSEHADQSGAVGALAVAPGGIFVLWAGAVCCAALALWWISEAVLSARRSSEGTWDVLRPAGKAAVFLGVGGLFLSYALGARVDSREKYQEITATVLAAPGGQALLFVAGLVLVGTGIYYGWRGLGRRFEDSEVEPDGAARRPVTVLGVVGYLAKGAALVIVGILVLVATVQLDPAQSTGLDGALKGLADQTFGPWLLGAVALGLACFGIYSMARAKYGKI